jgi:hypothetical protein
MASNPQSQTLADLSLLQLELANPDKEWKVFNLGDPEPSEFFVTFHPRYRKA